MIPRGVRLSRTGIAAMSATNCSMRSRRIATASAEQSRGRTGSGKNANGTGAVFQRLPDGGIDGNVPRVCHTQRKHFGFLR
jgi:hypothetical protein